MYCEVLGLKTEYERRGEGRPILILHGWGSSIQAMAPVANCVAALGYEAGVADYAHFTKAFIEQQGIVGCSVACHSFGGRVTIMLSAEDNALFDKLIMIDAAGVRPRRTIKYHVKTWAYKLAKKLARIGFIDRVFRLSKRQKNAGSADYRALKTDVMRKTFVNVVNQDLTPLLSGIRNDTLLIWGDKDTATPLEYAKLMEKKMPNAGLAVLGHFSYAEKYPQFCAVMKAYLKE